MTTDILISFLANVLNDRLNKRFAELSRLATNIECIDQLMDLLRVQNSMDEILTLISQVTSPQVHARIAELLHTLLNVSSFFFLLFDHRLENRLVRKKAFDYLDIVK